MEQEYDTGKRNPTDSHITNLSQWQYVHHKYHARLSEVRTRASTARSRLTASATAQLRAIDLCNL
jgi:hypothetical protein